MVELKLSRLYHPSLARALDFGRTKSAVYYTRELAPRDSVVEALGAPDEHTLVQCLAGIATAWPNLPPQ